MWIDRAAHVMEQHVEAWQVGVEMPLKERDKHDATAHNSMGWEVQHCCEQAAEEWGCVELALYILEWQGQVMAARKFVEACQCAVIL